MKQIITLLSFCLLFSAIAPAAALETSTAETVVPVSSAVQDAGKLPDQLPAVILSDTTPTLNTPNVQSTAPATATGMISEVNTLSNYLLSPGETMIITVWKEEGLQEQQYLISPDGTIIFPLVGTVIAAGKTITELKDYLTTRLADYITDPSITVKILNNQGNSVFVIGKVNKPGQYFSGRKIDVLQAISLAGGLTVYADDDSISVLRRIGNVTKVYPFDYTDVMKGESLEQNILLEPGDTVTVP
ncbi:polysaccharide biosynthesis/export family protein [Methylomonas sp. AM2-LC]|uniref:polysaccharide biosynthesis/export family protein n=1 Tax=Methylomonas sp. AM2-LC TaxID=3153301 RepID=UPI00326365AF